MEKSKCVAGIERAGEIDDVKSPAVGNRAETENRIVGLRGFVECKSCSSGESERIADGERADGGGTAWAGGESCRREGSIREL